MTILPLIISVIDEYYSTAYITTVTTAESLSPINETIMSTTSNIVIVKPQAISSKGKDALIVEPAEIIVRPYTELNAKITVLFKHIRVW